MIQTCEACESAPVDVVDRYDDEADPFRLCTACDERLQAGALRPLEWYNLARRHGPDQYLLHDDLYDDGIATAPEQDVEDAELFPAPTLADVTGSPRTLLDFSIVHDSLPEDVVAAWAAHPAAAVLEELSHRYAGTRNASIRETILEVCAAALGPAAGDFVRSAWSDLDETVGLVTLARASAACLPFREGFDRVRAVVEAAEGREQRELIYGLGCFHTAEVLPWIEQHVASPVTDQWGWLAAESGLDWPTAERWLASGRPLSLVAIDALLVIVRREPPVSPLLRLHQAPDARTLEQALTAYMQRDPVPRVEGRTRALLSAVDLLAAGGPGAAGE